MKRKKGNSSLRKLKRAYQELHSELVKAYWKTESKTAKDSIQELSGNIYDFLSELESDSFSSRDADLKRCCLRAGRIAVKIEKSRKQIDRLVKSAKIAAKIADAMDKALVASAKLMV